MEQVRQATTGPGSSHLGQVAKESTLAFAVAVALVLMASLVNFLRYHGYPLLRPESGIAAAMLLATGLIFSLLYVWHNPYWRAFLQAVLVYLAVDLNADKLLVAGALSAATLSFVILQKKSLLAPLSILAFVVLVTGIVGLGGTKPFETLQRKPQGPQGGDLPAVLHLILDEHIGIEGIPGTGPEAIRAKSELRQAYVAQGFRVYGRAYSRHMHTVNAIPAMLNFGQVPKSEPGPDGVRVGPNPYFEYLARAGYRLNIVQSEFADFCSNSTYATCATHFAHSLRLLDQHRFTRIDRAKLIYFKFLSLSGAVVRTADVFDNNARVFIPSGISLPRAMIKRRGRSVTLGALAAFDGLIADLKNAKPGDAFFAHFLLPHYPYVVRRDCSTLPPNQWEVRSSRSPIEVRQGRYFNQVRCATRKVEQAIASLKQSAAGKNFVVIVHGDHGSRITERDANQPNLGRYSSGDMIAGFSTLFAVRGNGLAPGYEERPAAVTSLLRQLVEGDFKTAPAPQANGSRMTVILDDWKWKPRVRAEMPAEWASSPVPNRDKSRFPVPQMDNSR